MFPRPGVQRDYLEGEKDVRMRMRKSGGPLATSVKNRDGVALSTSLYIGRGDQWIDQKNTQTHTKIK